MNLTPKEERILAAAKDLVNYRSLKHWAEHGTVLGGEITFHISGDGSNHEFNLLDRDSFNKFCEFESVVLENFRQAIISES